MNPPITADLDFLKLFMTEDERGMLVHLTAWSVQGCSVGGGRITERQQLIAMGDYQKFMQTVLDRWYSYQKELRAQEVHELDLKLAEFKQVIEVEMLNIERMKVYVSALEVAVSAGASGQDILDRIEPFRQSILPLPVPRLLEKK